MNRSQSLIQVSGRYERGARPRKAAKLKNELAYAKAESKRLREDARMSQERELEMQTTRGWEKLEWMEEKRNMERGWMEEKRNMEITMEAMQAERSAWEGARWQLAFS